MFSLLFYPVLISTSYVNTWILGKMKRGLEIACTLFYLLEYIHGMLISFFQGYHVLWPWSPSPSILLAPSLSPLLVGLLSLVSFLLPCIYVSICIYVQSRIHKWEKIIWCLTFWVWLISLHLMIVSCTHFPAHYIISFLFIIDWEYIVYICHSFSIHHLLMDTSADNIILL